LATFLLLVLLWSQGRNGFIFEPDFVKKVSKWSVFGILTFTAFFLVWGTFRYVGQTRSAGEYALRFCRTDCLKISAREESTTAGKALLSASFKSQADGLYRIGIPDKARGPASGLNIELLRLSEPWKFSNLNISGKGDIPLTGRDFLFDPIKNSKGKDIKLQLWMSEMQGGKGSLPTISVITCYSWYRGVFETAGLVFFNLISDRTFFIFYSLVLGLFLIIALTNLVKART